MSTLRAEFIGRLNKPEVDALVAWLVAQPAAWVERAGADPACCADELTEGARVVSLSTAGLEARLRDAGLTVDGTLESHKAAIRFAFEALLEADVLPIQAKAHAQQLVASFGPRQPTATSPGATAPLSPQTVNPGRLEKARVDALAAWLMARPPGWVERAGTDPALFADELTDGARVAMVPTSRTRAQTGPTFDRTPESHMAAIRLAFEALLRADVLPIQAKAHAQQLVASFGPRPPAASSTDMSGDHRAPHALPPQTRGPLFESGRKESQLPWWLRLGSGQPVVSEECQVAGCQAGVSPVDLYCSDHSHDDLLLFQDWPTDRVRWWAVNTARSVGAGLVLLSAYLGNIWPIYGLAAAIGCICLGFLLHAHRPGRFIAIAGFIATTAAVGALVAADIDSDTWRLVGTGAVGLPLAVAAFLCVATTRHLTRGMADGIVREAMCAIVTSIVVALLAVSAWWAVTGPLTDWFVEIPVDTSSWLLYSGLGAAGSTVMAAAIGALLLSRGAVDLRVTPLIKNLPKARKMPWDYRRQRPAAPRRPTPIDRFAWRLALTGHKLISSMVDLARRIADRLLAIKAAIHRRICRCLNWVHRRLVRIGRRVKFVASNGTAIYGAAARTGASAVAYCARPLGAYAAAVGASIAALHLASAYTDYLLDGAMLALAAGAAWSVVGLVLCAVIVERLASVPASGVSRAVRRFANTAGPDFGIVIVLSGALLGLPGTLFGHGPMRIGWVTSVGLLVFGAVMLFSWVEGRANRPAPPTGPPHRA